MTRRQGRISFRASLGTFFARDLRSDVVLIATPDGTEIEVPGPDLRQLLESLSSPDEVGESAYGAVLDSVRQRVELLRVRVEREEKEAVPLLTELLAVPRTGRREVAEGEERFRTYSLCSLALERARTLVLDDPPLALELAEVAVSVSELLDPRRYGGAQVRDLQGYSLAVLANAHRVSGDLRRATALFRSARERLALGTIESTEGLETDRLESSLCRDLRDFPRALELIARVEAGYRDRGQTDDVAQALQKRALVLDEMGDLERAIEVLQEAESIASESADGLLQISIGHGLVVCLNRLGRSQEAAELFERLQPLYLENHSTLLEARRVWTAGTIALDLGDLEPAAESIAQARSLFEREGYPFETALTSLDLAAALIGLGRWGEAKRLATSTYAFMSSQDIHPDALAALAVFQQAAAREELSRDVLRRIARQLKKAPVVPPAPC